MMTCLHEAHFVTWHLGFIYSPCLTYAETFARDYSHFAAREGLLGSVPAEMGAGKLRGCKLRLIAPFARTAKGAVVIAWSVHCIHYSTEETNLTLPDMKPRTDSQAEFTRRKSQFYLPKLSLSSTLPARPNVYRKPIQTQAMLPIQHQLGTPL
jgi:hypothetical protein